LFQDVVEIEAFGRPPPLEGYAGIGGQFGVTFRVVVSGSVRVGGARDNCIRDGGEVMPPQPKKADAIGWSGRCLRDPGAVTGDAQMRLVHSEIDPAQRV
jgi:hypothetical protein